MHQQVNRDTVWFLSATSVVWKLGVGVPKNRCALSFFLRTTQPLHSPSPREAPMMRDGPEEEFFFIKLLRVPWMRSIMYGLSPKCTIRKGQKFPVSADLVDFPRPLPLFGKKISGGTIRRGYDGWKSAMEHFMINFHKRRGCRFRFRCVGDCLRHTYQIELLTILKLPFISWYIQCVKCP